jgi:hypothetical protein
VWAEAFFSAWYSAAHHHSARCLALSVCIARFCAASKDRLRRLSNDFDRLAGYVSSTVRNPDACWCR